MKRLLIPILIIPVLVSVLLLGCSSVPPSEPASSQESGLLGGSASSEYQQQINEIEQQVQSLSQQVDSLEESISALERKLETLPIGTSSDFEARIEQQMSQLGEQIDELNAEVSAINEQLAEQGAEEEATSSTSAPTPPSGTIFTFSGQGRSQSLPFTIHSSPWKLQLWAKRPAGSSSFTIHVFDPPQGEADKRLVGRIEFVVEGPISARETISYIPAGTYYLDVHGASFVTWTVWIIEL